MINRKGLSAMHTIVGVIVSTTCAVTSFTVAQEIVPAHGSENSIQINQEHPIEMAFECPATVVDEDGTVHMTQSADIFTDGENSVGCTDSGTTPQGWARCFDLAAEGISGDLIINTVYFGIQQATIEDILININLYIDSNGCPPGAPGEDAILLATGSRLVGPNDELGSLKPVHFPEGTVAPAGSTLIVEIEQVNDGNTSDPPWTFLPRSNDLGQCGPSYIRAADCGLPVWDDLAELGFPDAHLVIKVIGSEQEPQGNPACNEDAGDCCEGNGTPGCNDSDCCEAVCEFDPFCCDVLWDDICGEFTFDFCNELCFGTDQECECPAGALEEGEDCGDDNNGGCNSEPPAYIDASCGDTFCGNAWADGGTRDTDWYLVNVDDPNGDGVSFINGALFSEFQGVCFIVGGIDTCEPFVLGTQGASNNCQNFIVASAAVDAPGTYAVFVSTSNFEGAPCGSNNSYTLEITCDDEGPGKIECEDTDCANSGNIQLTQSTACAIVNGAGIACGTDSATTENQFARSYTMDFDLGITCVGFGIETNTGFTPHDATMNVYLDTDGGDPQHTDIDLQLLGSVDVPVTTPLTMHYGNFDPPIEVFAGQVIVVEYDVTQGLISNPPTLIYPGSNLLGQSGPSYIKADDCGITAYIDLADLGFPDIAYVNTINGFSDEASPPCPWDLDSDTVIATSDLLILFSQWGIDSPADFDNSGTVDTNDLLILFANWGPCK